MPSSYDICPAKPSDVAEILQLIRELAIYEKLENEAVVDEKTLSAHLFGPQPRAHVLLACHDETVTGFCLYFYNFSTFLGKPGIYIEDIFVREAHRGHGIGQRFFKALAEKAKAEGCGRIEWWVLDWNQTAIDFYEKLGAEAMAEWTVYRLNESKFAALL